MEGLINNNVYVMLDELFSIQNDSKRMELIHEIAINDDFDIEQLEKTEMEKKIRTIAETAFWDIFSELIETNAIKATEHAITLIEEIKSIMKHDLIPKHSENLIKKIDSDININEIRNLLLDETHRSPDNYRKVANKIIYTMEYMCSPFRDELVKSMYTINDIVPLYKKIYLVIGLMKLDMANFMFSQIKPYIKKESVNLERCKFEKLLEIQKGNNVDGLLSTKKWLERFIFDSEKNQSEEKILNNAYMFLINNEISETDFPETMYLDKNRMCDIMKKKEIIVLTLYLVNTCYAIITQIDSHTTKFEGQTLSDKLVTKMTQEMMPIVDETIKNICIDCLTAWLIESNITEIDSYLNQLQVAFKSSVDSTNPALNMFRKRINDSIFLSLQNGEYHENQFQKFSGLVHVQKSLKKLINNLLKIIIHNKSVYNDYYANIFKLYIKS
ncbi:T-complex protein 11-like protein 2 [Intoshia linei]|uniref:T-complex protein 11-like protein 2 n=1 Tax=Intoshia linei TaxID=1819745 RepID=A0A177B0X0_9BILA|nr:T-complex protein 11-like protein 2 [Intoshia linei]